ncbi:hypothetical protein Zm00014a_011981 [Zea mays]|uniref:Uncharacterized protein n=1 Tax=Zea mays TaxID=4577 RepID=A0A317Y6H9_MAIZE|nr:hypothetical protein Zm00014a_011981 [Zea mays]
MLCCCYRCILGLLYP